LITGVIDPAASNDGPFTVVVIVLDANGGTTTDTFTWSVANPAPDATPNFATTGENSTVSGNVILDEVADVDPDGDALSVVAANGIPVEGPTQVTGSTGGTFTVNPDGSYEFTPGDDFNSLAEGETKTTKITYTISDGEGGTDTETLTVTVVGQNDSPVVYEGIPDQETVETNTVELDISDVFGDPDGAIDA
jgi:VCBS repeat-containing protein